MKVMRQRVRFYTISTSLGVLTSILILSQNTTMGKFYKEQFLVLTIFVTVFMFGFLIREYRRIKIAKLIVENQILHIQPAQIDIGTCSKNNASLPIGGIEVFISCFGILLDSKVIKFNLDGIHLKSVEIGSEFICLTYGSDEYTQKIRILHEAIDNQELQSIVQRFRYETDVVSVITD